MCVCERARERDFLWRAADLLSPSIRSRAFRQTKKTSVAAAQRRSLDARSIIITANVLLCECGGPIKSVCCVYLLEVWDVAAQEVYHAGAEDEAGEDGEKAGDAWKMRKERESWEKDEKRLNETGDKWHFVTAPAVMQFSHCQSSEVCLVISFRVYNLLFL